MNFIVLSLLLLIQGIPVQQGGMVTGVLRDPQGKPLQGVRMAAVARGGPIEEAATGTSMAGLAETDEQGRFTLESVPPGRYSIAAGRLDLQTYYPGTQSLADATILTVTPGATIPAINFVLNDTSLGRAGPAYLTLIAATIQVRVVTADGGKVPVSANGQLVNLRLESASSVPFIIPIDGPFFTVPGPTAGDFRVVVENMPSTYEVRSITYGATNVTRGTFQISAANFPTLPTNPTPTAQVTTSFTQILTLSPGVFNSTNGSLTLVSGVSLKPAATPPSTLTITIGEVARPSTSGVRVTGRSAPDKTFTYLSGRPGVTFSDGTFEFEGVQPGRHVIANTYARTGTVVVVGDKNLDGIELKDTLLLPADIRVPKDPMPAGSYAPGTIVPMARITGDVLVEGTNAPVTEGRVVVRTEFRSQTVPIDVDGHFESFALLPGTYDLMLEIFGHSSRGTTVTIEDKDLKLQLTTRRLY